MRMASRCFYGVYEADAIVGWPVRRLGPLFGGVLQAQLEWVHADARREFVDHALDRVCGDRRARRTVGGELRPIASDVVADDAHVFALVARECRHGTQVYERAREGATLERQLCITGRKTSVPLDADLHAHRARCGRAAGAEHVLPAHDHLDGSPGFARERKRERFEEYNGLAAEAA